MLNSRLHHIAIAVALCAIMVLAASAQSVEHPIRIGMAWQRSTSNYDRVARSIKMAGGTPIYLPQLRPAGFEYDSTELQAKYLDENGILLQPYADIVKRNTYLNADSIQTIENVDAVVFLGGCDISPTLFRTPEPWHGIIEERNYDPARDLSEYLTMTYCLDHDIPVLGLCRGMQMLTVVSGAPLIQDLGAYYASLGKVDHYVHRSQRDEKGNRHYTPHDVVVTRTNSLLHAIAGTDTIHNVPSWHHQVARDVDSINLMITGITVHDGVEVIEAVEHTDKTFALGVQFHPEEAVRMNLDDEAKASHFMPYSLGLEFFKALIYNAKLTRKRLR